MNDTIRAQYLLGKPEQGELILLVGPAYKAMERLAIAAGIEYRDAGWTNDIQALKASVDATGKSFALVASAPEVEGILDRASFDPRLAELVYGADRVVYGGSTETVILHPAPGVRRRVTSGQLDTTLRLDEVKTDEKAVGIRMGSL